MNLSMVGQLVSQHAGDPETQISTRKSEQEIVACMFKWITCGIAVLGLGVLMVVLGKSLVSANILAADVAVWFQLVSKLTVLSGIGIAGFGVLNGIRQGISLSGGHRSTELAEPVDTKQLPTSPIPDALPSVTEGTTRLISPEALPKAKVEVK